MRGIYPASPFEMYDLRLVMGCVWLCHDVPICWRCPHKITHSPYLVAARCFVFVSGPSPVSGYYDYTNLLYDVIYSAETCTLRMRACFGAQRPAFKGSDCSDDFSKKQYLGSGTSLKQSSKASHRKGFDTVLVQPVRAQANLLLRQRASCGVVSRTKHGGPALV